MIEMANASPITKATVELVVGAKFKGHTSRLIGVKRTTSDFLASVESLLAVSATIFTPIL